MSFIRYDMKSFKDKYRKQSWDRPCTTIFAHLERDGNRFIHPDSSQARTLTVREAARLQSFPDSYVFAGAMKSRYRQIGNAVPPLLSHAIARSIYHSLAGSGLLEHDCDVNVAKEKQMAD
jgi:DNA (cytosine-5)-methyltransferase 1